MGSKDIYGCIHPLDLGPPDVDLQRPCHRFLHGCECHQPCYGAVRRNDAADLVSSMGSQPLVMSNIAIENGLQDGNVP